MFKVPLSSLEPFSLADDHMKYLRSQNYHYNVLLPNIVPTKSSTEAPKQMVSTSHNVDTYNKITTQPTQNIHKPFLPIGVNPELIKKQKVCVGSSLDDLINTQSTTDSVRCGWMYTPSDGMNPSPQISRGSLGTRNGVFSFLDQNTNHQNWFWDLNKAKQTILTDTCKKLKNCTDLRSPLYEKKCGYCTDLHQGIPIGSDNNPLYPDHHTTTCSKDSLFINSDSCPAPPKPLTLSEGGPIVSSAPSANTCIPVNNKLPVNCIKQVLSEVGCSPHGALYTSLSNGATPDNYMAKAEQLQSMQIYNKFSSVPLDLNALRQGNETMPHIFKNLSELSKNANTESATSAIGASSRDLCLQHGNISQYDFCVELLPHSPPPFNIQCVQKLFLQKGGQPAGTMYPNPQNMQTFYNTLGSWQEVNSYINSLVSTANTSSIPSSTPSVRNVTNFVGCYGDEASFGGLQYTGGTTGSQYSAAEQNATKQNKPYFAMARTGSGGGHGFAFSSLSGEPDANGGNCTKPCTDDTSKACGCSDGECNNDKTPQGGRIRRWAVYKRPDNSVAEKMFIQTATAYNKQKDALMKLRGISIGAINMGLWTGMPYLVQYSIADRNNMAGIDTNGNVWMKNNWDGTTSMWTNIGTPIPDTPVKRVKISPNGVLMVLCGLTQGSTVGYNIYNWNGNAISSKNAGQTWYKVTIAGGSTKGFIDMSTHVSSSSSNSGLGIGWAIGEDNKAYIRDNVESSFTPISSYYPPHYEIPLLKKIELVPTMTGSRGMGFGIDLNQNNRMIIHNNGFGGIPPTGNVIEVAVASPNTLWHINTSNNVYLKTNFNPSNIYGDMHWQMLDIKLKTIATGSDNTVLATDMNGNLLQYTGFGWKHIMAPPF